MKRRHLLAAGAAPLLAPLAGAARGLDDATVRARIAADPLRTPFLGVADGAAPSATALLRGRWPAALRGHFYRNGPALMARAGERYRHWFDGDGMVQRYSLGDGQVTHLGRLVQTTKLARERAAGRLAVPVLGTYIEDTLPLTGPDGANTANTHVVAHAGRLLALWEGGSAHELDAATLETIGPVTWRADLKGTPFSAHPKVDAQGHLWNIGSMPGTLLVWHLAPDGQLAQAQVLRVPEVGGLVHDMAITERHLVVPLPPLAPLSFGPTPDGGARRFAMQPGRPLTLLVIDKADLSRQWRFELPAQMVFHVANAWDAGPGEVALSFIGGRGLDFLNDGATALMAALPRQPTADPQLLHCRLHLASGRIQVHGEPFDMEFPRVHPARVGLRQRWVSTAAAWRHRPQDLFHGWQLTDLDSGRTQRVDMGDHAVTEEPVWVPKPGGRGELDAWLLATHFDARRQATVLNLLDAAHLADGPLAQAVLPYALPLGFHGSFVPAD
ncbi:MAG: carotenoid oxygenase family protein [Proteobacteria bacterium]|nr:carotenoid oxygenase family protein [Pseudomonadota bacterium]